jgi:hypothetical protein
MAIALTKASRHHTPTEAVSNVLGGVLLSNSAVAPKGATKPSASQAGVNPASKKELINVSQSGRMMACTRSVVVPKIRSIISNRKGTP